MPKADNGTKDVRPQTCARGPSPTLAQCSSLHLPQAHVCVFVLEKAAVIQLNALSHTGPRVHCATRLWQRRRQRALLRLLGSSHNCESRLHIWLHCLCLSLATTFMQLCNDPHCHQLVSSRCRCASGRGINQLQPPLFPCGKSKLDLGLICLAICCLAKQFV